jgi:uncharacterized RDD family membrane protein YckC
MLSFAEQGAFAAETLVWRDGFDGWKPWSIAGAELKGESKPEKAKAAIDKDNILRNELAKASYASLRLRLCALIIDSVVIQLIFTMLTPLHAYFGVVSNVPPQTTVQELTPTMHFIFGLTFFYTVFFVKNFSGTLGKIALRLAVVRQDGQAMTWGCALLRTLVSFVSFLPFGIGYLLAAFDVEKRTVHDFIANTRVLKIETVN